MEGEDSTVVLDDIKLGEVITDDSLGFDEWTSLISEVEKAYPDNIEKICSVYDSFLLKFPLCYGYWRKYADHKIRLCTVDKVVEVFEKAVESATYSVAMWVDYCTFGSLVFEDPSDVRRLFKRSISFVGKDYLFHTLWDKYIDFEFSGKHWSSLANIYIQTLRFPTKKLHCYYDGFKKLVRILGEEMESYGNNTLEVSKESMLDDQVLTCYKQDEISCIIKDLLDPSLGLDRFKALQKYRYIGERFYQEASELNEKIIFFESRIKRSYFHVKPLDASQLENWHHYLDFAELHGNFDWVVKLYERCLIPCANYPEFWMRYVEYIESKGGREIANFALDRATQIFLKRVSAIHLFKARFKEHIGDVTNARATFLQCDRESDSAFVENVVMRANMERRLGNFIAASNVYNEALKMAVRKEKCHILPILYVHFSRLKYMTTDSEEAARDILMDGIKHVPFSKLLIEELIIFTTTHKGSEHINEVDSVVAKTISPEPDVSQGLSVKDREDISSQYLKFVDLCGNLHDVSNAWNRHVKLFPQSVRTTTYHAATGTKQWKIAMESRQETLAALPLQPSGDCNSDNLIRSSLQDNEQSLVENHDSEASLPDTDQVPDQRSSFLENHNMLSDQATVNLPQPRESENNLQENLHQTSLGVSEPPREGASEPILSFDLAHQVSNEADGAQASLEFSNEMVQLESDHGPKQDLMPPSLEMLSLDSQDSKSPGLVIQNSEAPHKISSFFPTPPEGEDPQERSLSNRSILKSEASPGNAMTIGNMPESQNANVDLFVSSPMSTRGTLSEQITTGNASPSSSASNQNITTPAFSQPHMPANSGRNWHQRSNSERNRRDSRFWNRGNSHRRMHQRRQPSPQRQYSQAETGSRMPNSQGYSSQLLSSQSSQVQQGSQVQSQFPASSAPANPMAPQAWSMHNMQQQNSSSAHPSQPTVQPGTYPQAQMSQYPMQTNEQQGNVQSNQAYNQMWQYYYCQQQQQFLWQQQQQMQQQPQQQQFMQEYQQQMLQLQYLQQQQQQLPYQQQQLQQLQQQQLQQQQLMQQQQQPYQLQQQPNLQQHFLYMQQQQQQYMQSQMQLQQHQHQHQQHHQQQTLLPPKQHEQRQPEQQTDTSHVEGSQQLQGTSAHTKDTSGSMGSPHPQQHSPDSQ